MDITLGALAFAALIVGQFSAVIAVHVERETREPTNAHPCGDHCSRLIWEGGY